ncbi:MAG: hypothetical protein WBY44_28085 [Bryobacteraceae bacterium]
MAGLMDAKAFAVKTYLATGIRPEFTGFSVSTLPRHNVTAVGVGRKYVNGKPTGSDAVRFYVERKIAKSLIPREHVLPGEITGVPTDVIQMGRFRLCAALPAPITGRFRPVQPGCSCSFQLPPPDRGLLTASTIGAIVQKGGKMFILSNNHALANSNAAPAGTPIFHPGLLDQPDLTTDQIAILTSFVTITADANNVVDCAIAELLDSVPFSSEILPDVGRLSSATPVAAAEGMTVVKAGRTTSATVGTVFETNGTVPVLYPFGSATFESQIFVKDGDEAFSDDGDSGALVVDQASKAGTGLLFAKTSDGFTACNPLSAVLTALGVTLVI